MEGSYRLDNELLPEILRKPSIEAEPVEEVATQPAPRSLPEENSVGEVTDIIPAFSDTEDGKISLLPNIDYKNANLEDLLRDQRNSEVRVDWVAPKEELNFGN
jgi:hypothetical protein